MLDVIRIAGLELRFLHTKDSTAGSLDMFEMTVDPNGRVPVAHYHESWDETVYGLSGTSTWRVAGEETLLTPGRSLFIARGTVHAFRNDSDAPAILLSVLSPGVLGPGYFREMAALVAAGRPDPALLRETMTRHGLIPSPEG